MPSLLSDRSTESGSVKVPGRHLRIVRGQNGLREITSDWMRVSERVAKRHFFHYPEWYAAYLNNLVTDADAVLFCVHYKDGVPDAVFPFQQSNRRFLGVVVTTLELPRHTHMHLSDFIVPEECLTPEFLRMVLRQLQDHQDLNWDVMCLRNTLEDSAATAMCRAARLHQVAGNVTNSCKYIELRGSYLILQQQYTKKFRGTLRNMRNRLRRLDNVVFDIARSPAELELAYQGFLDVEASGWKGSSGAGTAIMLDHRLRAFYADLVRSGSESLRCEIFSLRKDDQILASALCMLTHDTSYILKIGYDEACAYVSPAQMLIDGITRTYTYTDAIRTINFVSGVDWVDPWANNHYDVYSWYLFNSSLIGMSARIGASLNRITSPLISRAAH